MIAMRFANYLSVVSSPDRPVIDSLVEGLTLYTPQIDRVFFLGDDKDGNVMILVVQMQDNSASIVVTEMDSPQQIVFFGMAFEILDKLEDLRRDHHLTESNPNVVAEVLTPSDIIDVLVEAGKGATH